MNQDEKGRFVKGNNANPGGRTKGVATLIRELSNDYKDYIEMLDMWSRDASLTIRERRECIKELLNRGMGMPTQRNEISGIDIVVGLPPLDDILDNK